MTHKLFYHGILQRNYRKMTIKRNIIKGLYCILFSCLLQLQLQVDELRSEPSKERKMRERTQ